MSAPKGERVRLTVRLPVDMVRVMQIVADEEPKKPLNELIENMLERWLEEHVSMTWKDWGK